MRYPAKVVLAGICLVAFGCGDQLLAPPSEMRGPDFNRGVDLASLSDQWVEEIFIDRGPEAAHAGSGPHPEVESKRFSRTQGGIRWVAGGPVEYAVTGAEGVAGGNLAIETAIGTWDPFVTSRSFIRNDGTSLENPCRAGEPNRVEWIPIDGPGGTLAATGVCRNVATKVIAGFTIIMDTAESWSVNAGGELGKFDVEGVASHEFGHAVGLGHVNSPRDGCLTMYRFAQPGETQKRSLGLGDKLGMDALYGPVPDLNPGACGS